MEKGKNLQIHDMVMAPGIGSGKYIGPMNKTVSYTVNILYKLLNLKQDWHFICMQNYVFTFYVKCKMAKKLSMT